MVKVEHLSSDIDLIKEFEELKIKQKLLVESLKRKTQSEETKLFMEINSKLDFLVKIFNEANSHAEEEEEKNPVEDKLVALDSKLDEMIKNFEGKFKKLDSKIEEIGTVKETVPQKVVVAEKVAKPVNERGVREEKGVIANPLAGKKNDLPPPPGFKVNLEQGATSDKAKEESSAEPKIAKAPVKDIAKAPPELPPEPKSADSAVADVKSEVTKEKKKWL